ncbi:MAG: hypothetical protein WC436_04720 [Candidatus Babeliales bacterium]
MKKSTLILVILLGSNIALLHGMEYVKPISIGQSIEKVQKTSYEELKEKYCHDNQYQDCLEIIKLAKDSGFNINAPIEELSPKLLPKLLKKIIETAPHGINITHDINIAYEFEFYFYNYYLESYLESINAQDPLLTFAANIGNPYALCALIDEGADIDGVNFWGRVPLFNAKPTCLELLLSKGADPNIESSYEGLPIAHAPEFQQKLLMVYGAHGE